MRNTKTIALAGRDECQLLFLKAAADHPKIRLEQSLREQVLANCPRIDARNITVSLPEHLPTITGLLQEWADRSNLPYDWVVLHARRAILFWLLTNPDCKAFDRGPQVSPPTFQLGLQLADENKAAYRKRQVQQLKQHVDEHFATIQKMRAAVLPDRGSRDNHYRWTVERICLAWTWERIANEHAKHYPEVSPTAVRQEVVAICDKVGLPKTKPKLPRKS